MKDLNLGDILYIIDKDTDSLKEVVVTGVKLEMGGRELRVHYIIHNDGEYSFTIDRSTFKITKKWPKHFVYLTRKEGNTHLIKLLESKVDYLKDKIGGYNKIAKDLEVELDTVLNDINIINN